MFSNFNVSTYDYDFKLILFFNTVSDFCLPLINQSQRLEYFSYHIFDRVIFSSCYVCYQSNMSIQTRIFTTSSDNEVLESIIFNNNLCFFRFQNHVSITSLLLTRIKYDVHVVTVWSCQKREKKTWLNETYIRTSNFLEISNTIGFNLHYTCLVNEY